jgi:hypothetical protein
MAIRSISEKYPKDCFIQVGSATCEAGANTKNYKVYKVFATSVSEKDYAKIQELLQKMAKNDFSKYSAVVVSLKQFAESPNISKEMKDLIIKKLQEIPEDKRKNAQYNPQKIEFSKPSNSIPWKKIILVAIAILTAGIGYWFYSSKKMIEGIKKPIDTQNLENVTKPELIIKSNHTVEETNVSWDLLTIVKNIWNYAINVTDKANDVAKENNDELTRLGKEKFNKA